jgi:hypothetical protein
VSIEGKTFHRTKEERRRRAFCYQGNRHVIEWAWGDWTFPFVRHPNRVLRQHRLSNRSRAA